MALPSAAKRPSGRAMSDAIRNVFFISAEHALTTVDIDSDLKPMPFALPKLAKCARFWSPKTGRKKAKGGWSANQCSTYVTLMADSPLENHVNGSDGSPNENVCFSLASDELAFGYPRNFLDNQFVYTVISPRAGGLSIGV